MCLGGGVAEEAIAVGLRAAGCRSRPASEAVERIGDANVAIQLGSSTDVPSGALRHAPIVVTKSVFFVGWALVVDPPHSTHD